MNEAIKAMKQVPGLHKVSSETAWEHGIYIKVEVEEDGTVHQLNDEGKRDGILDDDGWLPNAIEVFE